jgi:hypothetical protein
MHVRCKDVWHVTIVPDDTNSITEPLQFESARQLIGRPVVLPEAREGIEELPSGREIAMLEMQEDKEDCAQEAEKYRAYPFHVQIPQGSLDIAGWRASRPVGR